MSRMAQRVQQFGTTIFTEMTNLANEHGAVNLGQGFPDFAAPDFLKDAAIDAIHQEINQYAPANGRLSLREAIAAKMERCYGLVPDPAREIVVTHGATEAIFAAIMALVNPGEEVVLFEPYYDSYVPSVQMAGGIPRFYMLCAPDWKIEPDRLAALFSPKTRLVVINTPHNPIGKVYTETELQLIADLCQNYGAIALVDEVYD
jgi:aspartate/methionine/tyrosine aminotransferase